MASPFYICSAGARVERLLGIMERALAAAAMLSAVNGLVRMRGFQTRFLGLFCRTKLNMCRKLKKILKMLRIQKPRDKILRTLVGREAYVVPVVSSYESKMQKSFDEQRVRRIWLGPIVAASKSILTWRRGYHDHQGGSLRVRPFHCTSVGLTPAIIPNVDNSGA
jgi:hypothetical protein